MARPALTGRVFAAALLVYLATAGGSLTSSDAVVAFDVTRNLCEHGSLAYSGELLGMEAHRGVDGRYYSPFGVAQSVYNVPFYILGRAAARTLDLHVGKSDSVPKAAVALGGTVAAAAAVALTWLLALEVTGSAAVALLAAALFGAGTVFWPYSKFGFNAPLATCCVLAGVLWLWSGVRRGRVAPLAVSGLAFGAAMLTRHELAIALLPAAAFLALAPRCPARLKQAVAGALGFGAGFATWMALNYVRFGNPFNPGYLGDTNPAFGSSLLWGTYGLLLSPSGSLFLYCPVALLGVPALVAWWREDRPATVLFAGLFVTFFAFYAQLGNWSGGRSYGPRYLVPVLPFLALAAARWLPKLRGRVLRKITWAVCALSVLVQLPGVLVDYSKVSVAWARQYPAGAVPDRRIDWSASPLLLNAEATLGAIPPNARYLAGVEPRPDVAVPPDARDFAQQFAFSLDFWWLYLFYLGAWGRVTALLVGTVLLVAGLVIAWRVGKAAISANGSPD